MATLLHIDSSPRPYSPNQQAHQSLSRQIAHHFVSEFNDRRHNNLIYRDLSTNPPPFIDVEWIAQSFAKQAGKEEYPALETSNELIEEVEQADVIVISSPMYNYGMPAVLKAWFDQVIRVNKTFSFDLERGENPIEPILSGKTVVLCTSSGESGFAEGGQKHHMNHLGKHIKLLSPYLGASQFHEITSEYQEFGDERHSLSFEGAKKEAKQLAARVAAQK
ncbi:FMN-dependent NADH-azoreductase [Vibrio sp. vnigr-6D03]|uniref:FMN-dependent NADH-azoreductase n=1 Tax=Vibrio sp. vnigr-6D03 TaxID=2058088 RepID=UPI000C31DF68|nr:NAD(P)H-dependent oxidoreductase [Vibrio sp. vnigr-6D03]PKF79980.1 FMN-dependent NADH-azoreductase [Vibrio sp. vnigr-6D03]